MRSLLIAVVVALVALSAGPAPVAAQPAPVPPTASQANGPLYPLVVGLGAITGVVLYNVATVGVSGVPFLGRFVARRAVAGAAAGAATGGAARAAALTTAAISMNRFYTVGSAVVGAWVFNWLAGN